MIIHGQRNKSMRIHGNFTWGDNISTNISIFNPMFKVLKNY